ncbi:MAG TPA: DUF1616 domain-containing protein [Ktedonobacteraceae bacterium]|nr:DUF1616 domain-containing protein [Ktedonobacteraceae bacterium]
MKQAIRNVDLIGAMCFALLDIGWALFSDRPLLVGALLAIPLVFILPGYTLTRALFHRRPADALSASSNGLILQPRLKIGQPFGAVDLIIFSLGLSLVIDVVTGLLLNLVPVGLQWQSWTFSLGLVTAVFALLAYARDKSAHVQGKSAHVWHIPLKEYALLGSALVVVALSLWLAIIRPPQSQAGFTQFWMLSSTQANNSCPVLIGVHSFESAPTIYRVQVMSDGTQLALWPSIMLTTQQEWDRVLPVSPAVGGSAVVDAQLYRLDQPGVIYREVHVTLRSCGILQTVREESNTTTTPETVYSDRRFRKQPGAFPRTHPTWAGRRVVE